MIDTTIYPLQRADLSQWLLKAVSDWTKKPTGLGEPPKDAGWQGENTSPDAFVPFTVITPASASRFGGGLEEPDDWFHMPYMVSSFGASPMQCELMADLARVAMWNAVLANTPTYVQLSNTRYRFMGLDQNSIGGLNRLDVTPQPYWSQTDAFNIQVSRE